MEDASSKGANFWRRFRKCVFFGERGAPSSTSSIAPGVSRRKLDQAIAAAVEGATYPGHKSSTSKELSQATLSLRSTPPPIESIMHFLSLLTVLLLPLSVFSFSFSTPSRAMCKCLCFSNSTIIPLYLPKDPLHPCLTCTRQFCLDQKLAACVGAESGKEDLDTGKGDEGDVEARCFRESVRG